MPRVVDPKTKKEYIIEFDDSSFDRQTQITNFSNKSKNYTNLVKRMDEYVDELDRFDDFDNLKISSEKYEKKEGMTYGIKKSPFHTGTGVIFEHQSKAALSFLKELRGFGLLADVVGSGKTFEACLVISELAIRNKLRSLLFIVPEQVIQDWIYVVEQCFGLGIGTLYQVKRIEEFNELNINAQEESAIDVEYINDFKVPRRPIITSVENFVKWKPELTKLLFDCVVVDEAHHLCSEEGEYAQAMKMLSELIRVKKKAKSTYCLLLSATPHSGNLDNMFRLWYFVRCTGGIPTDFDEKDDMNRSNEYRQEKDFYKNFICKNSSTVMEFIQNVKMSEVENSYRDEFTAFLTKLGFNKEYSTFPKGRRVELISDFLDSDPKIKDRVTRNIARAYHNRVLRSIMIRQPNAGLITKKKNVVNTYFFPTKQSFSNEIHTQGLKDEDITVYLDKLYTDKAIKCAAGTYTLNGYIEEFSGNMDFKIAYSKLVIDKILRKIENIDDVNNTTSEFEKKYSLRYYWDQLRSTRYKLDSLFIPENINIKDSFTYKYEYTKEIIDSHPNQKVIIFFDYNLKKKELVVEKFLEAMHNDPKYTDRIVRGTGKNKDKSVNTFNASQDAILVVADAAFTEGVNLQTCNIIINFQVTPDPLAMDQRIGRIFRLGQKNDVTIYSLVDMNKLEGYVLMYFSRIGLLTSNTGDATIIAGSNSERMVAIRCNRCRSVQLISKEDFDYRLAHDNLYCMNEDCVINHEKMTEICVHDFKCDMCGMTFTRSSTEEGYICISTSDNGNGVMCNSGEYLDRDMYCRKVCALSHCEYFMRSEHQNECKVVQAYKENKNIQELDMMLLCARCTSKGCPTGKCKIMSTTAEEISGCGKCEYSTCHPKPHVLHFDDKWEADCPICKEENRKGKLKPVVARTFSTYINASWDFKHDHGAGFCENLSKEAKKVAEIKDILDMDSEKDA